MKMEKKNLEEELKKFRAWKKGLTDEQQRELDSAVKTVRLTLDDYVSEVGGDRNYWFEIPESEAKNNLQQLTSGKGVRSFAKETRFRGQPCSSVISYIPVNKLNKQKAISCAKEISTDIMTRRPNMIIAKYISDNKLIVAQHYTGRKIIKKLIDVFEGELLNVVNKYEK